eukprot:COSAG01_NODE_431_length_17124_cov_26.577386_20_plen_168_part_00
MEAFDGWQAVGKGGAHHNVGAARGARGARGGRGATDAAREYCWGRFLNPSTLREMAATRRQFFGQLRAAGFVGARESLDTPADDAGAEAGAAAAAAAPPEWARNVGQVALVKCVLAAALYPALARVGPPAGRSNRPVLVTRTESVQVPASAPPNAFSLLDPTAFGPC